ncbi:hypothetical protein [Longispora albida]|uniref:hypothetical protein n=1 Tax=Longispora albida TaxID=203523 RepID=UPI00037A9546|nr:hypothetical protein [Longispora albida]
MNDQTPDAEQELAVLPALMSYRDSAPLGFAAPAVATVAAAGRRRTRRNTIVAAVAGLAMFGGVTAVLASPGDSGSLPAGAPSSASAPRPRPSASGVYQWNTNPPQPVPSSSQGAGSDELPALASLQLSDAGSGYTVVYDYSGSGEDHLNYANLVCKPMQTRLWRTTGRSLRQTMVTAGGETVIDEYIEEFKPGNAKIFMDYWRDFAGKCTFEPGYFLDKVGSGFAGQDSVMLRWTTPSGTMFHALIKQGDLVADLAWSGEQDALAGLSKKAASRMCAGTTAC